MIMKTHRIRTATSTVPDDPRRHLFVELKRNVFAECDPIGLMMLNDASIHQVRREILPKSGPRVVTYSDRAFRIGIIKDWRDEAVVIA